MKNLMLSTLLLICVSMSDAQFTCIFCGSSINQNGVEIITYGNDASCAQPSGVSTVSAVTSGSFQGCQTQYQFQPSTGTTTIFRGIAGSFTEMNSCTSPAESTSYTDSTTCCCNTTSNCNSAPVAVPKSYSCYACESSAYFDNGCGATTVATSLFVQQFQGCSACFKQVIVNEDLTLTYKRGCTRAMNINEECVTNSDSTTTTCSCTGSFCNSAEITARNFFFICTAVLLSAVYKLTF